MPRTPFKEVKLTQEQERKLEVARVAFQHHCPFYANLYYSIGKEVISRDIDTLCTDGRHIVINPEYFCARPVPEQVFMLAHEMAHMVAHHPQRMTNYLKAGELRGLPYDQLFANICADYVINADLVDTNIGEINPDWLYDRNIKGTELWEDVYERLAKQMPPPPPPPPGGGGNCNNPGNPGTQQQNQNSSSPGTGLPSDEPTKRAKDNKRVFGKPDAKANANNGAFDQILPPPVDPVTGDVDLPDEHEFQEAVARAAALAKAIGKFPASLQRLVGEILAPQVDWRDHIRMLVTGKIGSRHETWNRPNRRRLALNPIIIIPGRRGYGAETVVVGVDTSGSVGDAELNVFLSEVNGILNDVKPRRIVVIGCDAAVSQVDEITTLDEFEGLREKGIRGGGGTDFRPVFEHVEEHGLVPDALIYLTDLEGRFPSEAPGYPVIWAATTGADVPWGEVVRIKS